MWLVLRLVSEQRLGVRVRMVVVLVEVGLRGRRGRRGVLRRVVLVQRGGRARRLRPARLRVAVRVGLAGAAGRVATCNKYNGALSMDRLSNVRVLVNCIVSRVWAVDCQLLPYR